MKRLAGAMTEALWLTGFVHGFCAPSKNTGPRCTRRPRALPHFPSRNEKSPGVLVDARGLGLKVSGRVNGP